MTICKIVVICRAMFNVYTN